MRMSGSCLLALLLLAPAARAPAGHDATTLREMKAAEFAVADANERQRLAAPRLPTVLRNCTGMFALFLVPGTVLVLADGWRGRVRGAATAA